MTHLHLWLVVVFAALQIGDGLTTIIALRRANLAEGNPFAARAMAIFGAFCTVLLFKTAAIALAILVATVPVFAAVRVPILALAVALYAWVVADNARLILRSGRDGQ